jgi:hypothetical protein
MHDGCLSTGTSLLFFPVFYTKFHLNPSVYSAGVARYLFWKLQKTMKGRELWILCKISAYLSIRAFIRNGLDWPLLLIQFKKCYVLCRWILIDQYNQLSEAKEVNTVAGSLTAYSPLPSGLLGLILKEINSWAPIIYIYIYNLKCNWRKVKRNLIGRTREPDNMIILRALTAKTTSTSGAEIIWSPLEDSTKHLTMKWVKKHNTVDCIFTYTWQPHRPESCD